MSDERINVNVAANDAALEAGMQHAQTSVARSCMYMRESLGGLGSAVERIKMPFVELLAVVGGGKLFGDVIEHTEQFGEQLAVTAQQTGLAVEQLSALQYAAKMTSVSTDTLNNGLVRLARQLQMAITTGTSSAAQALQAIGVTATDAQGRLRPLSALLPEIADAFQHMQDGTTKAAIAQSLFSRAGAEMIPLLNQGRGGIQALEDQAAELGDTMTGEGVESIEQYRQSVVRLKTALEGLEHELAIVLMPVLTKLAQFLTGFVASLNDLIGATGMFTVGLMDIITGSFTQASHAFAKSLDYMKDAYRKFTDVVTMPTTPGAQGSTFTPTIPKDDGKSERESALRAEEAHQLALLQIDRENADLMRQLGLETAEQQLAEDQDFAQREYDIKLATLKKILALYDDDPKKKAEINQKIAALADQQAIEVTKANNKATLALAKQWDDAFQHVNGTVSKFFDAWVKGTMSAGAAIQAIIGNLVKDFITAESKKTETHFAGEAAKTAATAAGVGARVSLEAWGAVQSAAKSAWAALVWVANEAVKAIASTWASISAIPIVGPFMAPGLALATGAAVFALAGSVRSAAGGYDVPAGLNPMTQLHAQEMVLPKEYANVIRGLAQGGGSAGGGDVHVHIHAVDAQSVKRLFTDHRDAMADALKRAHKEGRVDV